MKRTTLSLVTILFTLTAGNALAYRDYDPVAGLGGTLVGGASVGAGFVMSGTAVYQMDSFEMAYLKKESPKFYKSLVRDRAHASARPNDKTAQARLQHTEELAREKIRRALNKRKAFETFAQAELRENLVAPKFLRAAGRASIGVGVITLGLGMNELQGALSSSHEVKIRRVERPSNLKELIQNIQAR